MAKYVKSPVTQMSGSFWRENMPVFLIFHLVLGHSISKTCTGLRRGRPRSNKTITLPCCGATKRTHSSTLASLPPGCRQQVPIGSPRKIQILSLAEGSL